MWLLKVITGSHAYGTNTPASDIDTRGIFYEPDDGMNLARDGFLGLNSQGKPSDDHSYYNLKKFLLLAQKCNPNVLEPLYIDDPRHILISTAHGAKLHQNRHLFLSSMAYGAYSGYANLQMKRMKNHNKWINNPQPADKPDITGYMQLCLYLS